MLFNRAWVLGIVLACGLAAVLAQGLATAQQPAVPGRVKIGTYNTRAVALAYGRSEENKGLIDRRTKEGKEAEAKKDEKTYDKIKAEMSDRQDRLHAQVFSNAPIDDIMAGMKGALPDIARKAGVSAIVPEVNYHDPAVEVMDVTDVLVQHFKPTDKTLKMIKEIKEHPPLRYSELAKHKD